MCGISGVYQPTDSGERGDLRELADAMSSTLTHRGPDGEGSWFDPSEGIAFAHRRLAIIDLTDEGHQPMRSSSGRFVITFNGEIYNFPALRRELEAAGCRFRGHSDTEVMLAAIEVWGLQKAVARFVGMFAFALWDKQARLLHLVRDRLGKKPLYYTIGSRACAFASELRALHAIPGCNLQLDREAVSLMLRHAYVPAPRSIYASIRKLTPGSILTIASRAGGALDYREQAYWSVAGSVEAGRREPFQGTLLEATDELDALLKDAVGMRMISDVPLGAFLSGGIDSSCIVALMQCQATGPIHTFTIGFRQEEFNEAEHARLVASHLGAHHTEMYVDESQVLDVVPRLGQIFDEPFADSSQIPTLLLSQLTRRHVTVALSGDGGDELFSGYRRYMRWRELWRAVNAMPRSLRRTASRSILALAEMRSPVVESAVSAMMSAYPGRAPARQQMQKLAAILGLSSQDEVYEWLVTQWQQPPVLADSAPLRARLFAHHTAEIGIDEYFARMSEVDMQTYLPDDILVKVDRASMAASLETRAPLLDHRVVEFAARLPFSMKVHGKTGKWILRQLAYRYVPKSILDRPKVGFGAPVDHWLRGALKQWAGDLLSPSSLGRSGCIDVAPVRRLWESHCDNTGSWGSLLWNVLMFQSWYEQSHLQGQ